MLRQQQTKPYKKKKNFEDLALYKKEIQKIPIADAMGWSVFSHFLTGVFIIIFPLILLLVFGINLDLFHKVKPKQKDIQFVLVNQKEEQPINKKTPFRSDKNTRAGGKHDPNKPIAPVQQALPKSAPSQQGNSKPQKIKEKKVIEKIFGSEKKKENKKQDAPKNEVKEKVKQVQTQYEQKQNIKPKPVPPKPLAQRPSIPPTKAKNTMKLPIPPTNGTPKISTSYSGNYSNPTGKYGGSGSSGVAKPVMASGGYGQQSARMSSNKGGGRGSAYSPGGGNIGNPGPGNPNGRPGIDAIKEPNFGPYMSELSRRIKSNWDPPRGDESKRVVLFFKIAKDGRLLNVRVLKSSGTPAADRAAMAAVELTAPFRPLPPEYRESSIDIQFTFDYNVFGVNKY